MKRYKLDEDDAELLVRLGLNEDKGVYVRDEYSPRDVAYYRHIEGHTDIIKGISEASRLRVVSVTEIDEGSSLFEKFDGANIAVCVVKYASYYKDGDRYKNSMWFPGHWLCNEPSPFFRKDSQAVALGRISFP